MTSPSFLNRYGAEPTPDEFTVHYEPGSIGLGLTTEENVPGVSVMAVREGSHSQKDGRIEQGHRIMAVNGVDVSNATQEEAVEVIKRATGDHFFLTFAETTVTAPVVPVKEDKKEAPGSKEEEEAQQYTKGTRGGDLVYALMKSKTLKTCTEEEANSAIRAVGLDKDAARKFIIAAREQQKQEEEEKEQQEKAAKVKATTAAAAVDKDKEADKDQGKGGDTMASGKKDLATLISMTKGSEAPAKDTASTDSKDDAPNSATDAKGAAALIEAKALMEAAEAATTEVTTEGSATKGAVAAVKDAAAGSPRGSKTGTKIRSSKTKGRPTNLGGSTLGFAVANSTSDIEKRRAKGALAKEKLASPTAKGALKAKKTGGKGGKGGKGGAMAAEAAAAVAERNAAKAAKAKKQQVEDGGSSKEGTIAKDTGVKVV